MTGQSLVEFAFVLPIMLVILLGVVGYGLYFVQAFDDRASLTFLAQLAQRDPGWRSAVPEENRRSRCNADPLMPEVITDRTGTLYRWHCRFDNRAFLIVPGIPNRIDVEVKAPSASPSPQPTRR